MRETLRERLEGAFWASVAKSLGARSSVPCPPTPRGQVCVKCGGPGSNKPGPCPEGEEGSKPTKPSGGGGKRPGGGNAKPPAGKPSGYAVAQRLAAGLARLPECSRRAAEQATTALFSRASAKYGEAAAREVASSALVGVARITTVGELLAVAGLASLVKSFGGGKSPAGHQGEKSPDMGDPKARAALMADLLGGTLGEDALLAFQGPPRQKRWDPNDHPRGSNGRFIPKGSAEAVASAKKELAAAKGKKHTPESAAKVLSHLNLLTVKQLKALRKELGLKAPGTLRAQLVKNIHERLTGSVEVETQKPQAKPKKKPEPNPEENPSALPPEPQGKILPDRPIAERLAAYHYGKALAAHIAKMGPEVERARAKYRSLRSERESAQKLYGETLMVRDEAMKDGRKLSPKLLAAMKKAKEEWLDLQKAEESAGKAVSETAKAHKEAVDKLLKVADPVKFDHEKLPGMSPDQIAKIDAVIPWVQSITGGAMHLSDVTHKTSKTGRAYFTGLRGATNIIATPAHTTSGSVAHEYGHYLENNVPGVYEASSEFLSHRVGNEAPVKLAEKFPQNGFGDDEVGRKDNFDKLFGDGSSAYYVGKHYDGQKDTEIVSMGVQMLYNDPSGFCAKDPEYAAFIIGILRGHLRK